MRVKRVKMAKEKSTEEEKSEETVASLYFAFHYSFILEQSESDGQ